MPVTLAIANQKGGVGKTTTATSLAHALGLAGRSVLLIDIDPQGNATSGLGLELVPNCPAFLPTPSDAAIAETTWQGVYAIPAGRDLETLVIQGIPSIRIIQENLTALAGDRFDIAIIDCPPSLGSITQNALIAAQAVLIPIQCEYYPLEGLVQLIGSIEQARRFNPDLRITGILLTMYDATLPLSHEVEAEVRGKLAEPVFRTVIPRDVAVAEAPSHCQSVIDYAPRSRGARSYVELAIELSDSELFQSIR